MRARSSMRGQRGASLVETLIAFLVLSFGLVGMARLQAVMRHHADLARQRTEAVHLAQEDMETLRDFSSMTATDTARSYEQIQSSSATVSPSAALAFNTDFTVDRHVAEGPGYRNAEVQVSWRDRSGEPQRVSLTSTIAATPAAFSGALAAQSTTQTLRRLRGRSALIPLWAKDLGDGTSVWKPASAGSIAWVFDNTTGAVRARCTGIANTTLTPSLTAADLTQCTAYAGVLLSGVVRFSLASPPNPSNANDTPRPLSIALALSPAPTMPPECLSEAQKVVRIATAGATRREAVPLDATPASWGVSTWEDLGERFVAYHCVIAPVAGGWSGRSSVVPEGWTIGTASTDLKVCRYSSDLDGSGAIDSNAEHPSVYSHVDGPLMQQNFLVVKGDQACPWSASTATAGGTASSATVQHQP